jgi:hypothetical protein
MALFPGRTAKRLLAGLFGAALVGGGAWLAADWYREKQAERLIEAYVQQIVALLDLADDLTFHQRVDRVRTFVNDNSVHKIDKAFWANHGNAAAFAAGVIAHAQGKTSEPVHMECSTRSNLMGLILRALGYETRVVAIFDSHANLKSHSFLEVMNPETGKWETQDADFDIYWRRKASGERISLAEAAEVIDGIEPCGRDGCGWDQESREGKNAEELKPYLDIVSITEKQKAVRYALYTSRADLERIYSKGGEQGRFCEVEAKRCRQGFFDIRSYRASAADALP